METPMIDQILDEVMNRYGWSKGELRIPADATINEVHFTMRPVRRRRAVYFLDESAKPILAVDYVRPR